MKLVSYDKFRTPLARARGWGGAHHGASHWWATKLSSLALIPLVIWFTWSVLRLTHATQVEVVTWLQHPWNAIALILFIGISAYHGALGLQVVLEDYVGHNWRIPSIILIKFAGFLLTIASTYAILLMSFSAGIQ